MFTDTRRFIIAFSAFVLVAHNALGQTDSGLLITNEDLQLSVPLGAGSPVIELTYVGGFIDSDDRIQTKVFVEGEAAEPRYILEVYRPAYMKEAGTFRTQLTETEFRRLLRSFGNESVLEVPQADLSGQVNAEATAAQTLETLEVDTHNARVQIDFRVDRPSALESNAPPELRSLQVPANALESAARAEPVVTRNIANGVLALEGLARLKELERVD